jgi:hypothetical protein
MIVLLCAMGTGEPRGRSAAPTPVPDVSLHEPSQPNAYDRKADPRAEQSEKRPTPEGTVTGLLYTVL